MTTETPDIQVQDVERVYQLGSEQIHALNGITLSIPSRRMTAIVGRSGSGKTTLLNIMAGLDTPTHGDILVLGRGLSKMSETERLALRRETFGFVFQNFGLLPLLTATENVEVPLRMRKMSRQERDSRVQEALEWVGLFRRARHRPYELSGGEQQRVALARALAARPRIILADEPTGQLDSVTGLKILALMRRFVEEFGITTVIVSHDPQVMNEADVIHTVRDGRLIPVES
jgi:putative ABC transport system ATP-binding protein